jgi:hypothetical protein
VVLAHFDSYSAALVFARWGTTLLMPEALPESAQPMPPPAVVQALHAGDAVSNAIIARYGLQPAELVRVPEFDAWVQTNAGPLRIHLLRFTTFEAPAESIRPHGGEFKPISALRGAAALELNLLRRVFDIIIGGAGATARG